MYKKDIFQIINKLFMDIALGNDNNSYEEIEPLLDSVLNEFASANYIEMEDIRGGLFYLGRKYDNKFFNLLYIMFQTRFDEIKIIHRISINELDYRDFDKKYLKKKLMKIYESSLTHEKQIRLSEFDPDINVSPEEASALLTLVIDLFRFTTSKFMLEYSEITMLITWAGIARKLSIINNSIDYFYVLLENIIDVLTTSQRFQLARDFAEEILILSFKDNNRHWGYFIQFKVFNGQHIARETIIYINACLHNIISRDQISNTFFETFLINVYRFYRNYGFVKNAVELYEFILANTNLSEYQKENITCSHYQLLVLTKNKSVILKIFNYLNDHSKNIIEDGELAIIPWLNLLYITQRQFGSNKDISLIEQFLPIFESITDKKTAERLRIFAHGDSPKLKKYFIDSLISHYETRDADDFAGEILNSLVIANRMIEYSYKKNDTSAYLMAMLLKADHTYVFKEQDQIMPFHEIKDLTHDKVLFDHYNNYVNFIMDKLKIPINSKIVWLALSEGKIYQLSFYKNKFSRISVLSNYNQEAMNNWNSEGIKLLAFDETIIINGQAQHYFEENQKHDLDEIIKRLSFMKCNLDLKNGHNIFLIRDMELSGFPHNLLLNSGGELLHKDCALTNVLSTEWFINNEGILNIKNNYTSSLWIPIKEGDIVLNLLFSKIEKMITEYEINLVTDSIPINPLNSDINILIAHGDKGISSFPFLFTNDMLAITNINKVIVECKILILFVCHSGSFKKSNIRQKLNSMVRVLLTYNIQTVIAPFWPLHISIPPIWLPAFYDHIKKGNPVSEAVFLANKKVFEKNMNPGAWCCMHTFGNPNINIADNEELQPKS